MRGHRRRWANKAFGGLPPEIVIVVLAAAINSDLTTLASVGAVSRRWRALLAGVRLGCRARSYALQLEKAHAQQAVATAVNIAWSFMRRLAVQVAWQRMARLLEPFGGEVCLHIGRLAHITTLGFAGSSEGPPQSGTHIIYVGSDGNERCASHALIAAAPRNGCDGVPSVDTLIYIKPTADAIGATSSAPFVEIDDGSYIDTVAGYGLSPHPRHPSDTSRQACAARAIWLFNLPPTRLPRALVADFATRNGFDWSARWACFCATGFLPMLL